MRDSEETVGSTGYARGRLAVAAAGIGVALALTGCGAGQITQTASQVAAVNGAEGDAGPIAIRNAQLGFPTIPEKYYRAGDDAPLLLTIANSAVADDELRSVRSDAAERVEVTGSRNIPGNFALQAVAPESGSATPSSAAAEPSESAGSESSAAGSSESAPSSAAVPPGGDIVGEVRIVLTGLRRDVRPGQLVSVTFSFAKAGDVTMNLPIGDPPPATQE